MESLSSSVSSPRPGSRRSRGLWWSWTSSRGRPLGSRPIVVHAVVVVVVVLEELSWHPSESWSVTEFEVQPRSPVAQASARSEMESLSSSVSSSESWHPVRVPVGRRVGYPSPSQWGRRHRCRPQSRCRRRCPPRGPGIRPSRGRWSCRKSSRGRRRGRRRRHRPPSRCRRRCPRASPGSRPSRGLLSFEVQPRSPCGHASIGSSTESLSSSMSSPAVPAAVRSRGPWSRSTSSGGPRGAGVEASSSTESLSSSKSSSESWHPSESWSVVGLEVQPRSPVGRVDRRRPSRCRRPCPRPRPGSRRSRGPWSSSEVQPRSPA